MKVHGGGGVPKPGDFPFSFEKGPDRVPDPLRNIPCRSSNSETWEPPQFWKRKALGAKRPFSEQLSEFRGILGATLGMALRT